jgi:acyl carrier protein
MGTEIWYIWAIALVFATGILAILYSMFADYQFRAKVASRPPLNDDQFIATYYNNSEIPCDIPLRLRPIYADYFEIDPQKIHPDELPPDIGEFDTQPLVDAIENEFNIKIDDDEQERTTGEFDSIVKCIYRITHQ